MQTARQADQVRALSIHTEVMSDQVLVPSGPSSMSNREHQVPQAELRLLIQIASVWPESFSVPERSIISESPTVQETTLRNEELPMIR
ncbi:MAG TPA: hypothetical protein VGH37_12940 [Candidatus Acidoferrum sp.]